MSGHYVWNITKQKKHYGHNVHQSNSILCFGKANDIKFDKTIFINWGVFVSIVYTFMVFTQTFSVWVFYLKTLGSLLRAFCYQAFSFLVVLPSRLLSLSARVAWTHYSQHFGRWHQGVNSPPWWNWCFIKHRCSNETSDSVLHVDLVKKPTLNM